MNFGVLYTLPATILMAALYTVSFCLTVASIKRVIHSDNKSDYYSIYSIDYIKKWIVDTLIQLSLTTIQPLCNHLFAILVTPPWCKIGKRAEISTVDHISADLLSIDDGSFIADSQCRSQFVME